MRNQSTDAPRPRDNLGSLHDDALLNGVNAARFLRVSRTTFYKWLADGNLPQPIHGFFRVGSLRAFTRSASQ